jgi:hypothetical protein
MEHSTGFAIRSNHGVDFSHLFRGRWGAVAAALGVALGLASACGGTSERLGRSPLTAGADSGSEQGRDSTTGETGASRGTGGETEMGGAGGTAGAVSGGGNNGGAGTRATDAGDGQTCLTMGYDCSRDSDCCTGYCANALGTKVGPGLQCQRLGCAVQGASCQSRSDCCTGGAIDCAGSAGSMVCIEYGH